MANPQRNTTVLSEAVGDGLAVFDPQRKQSHVLNATSALVFQHCDGQTTPQQLTELVRKKFNLPRSQAEQLMWLALDELEKANLLQDKVATTQPPRPATLTRRQVLTAFAGAGLSLALLPIVSGVMVTQAQEPTTTTTEPTTTTTEPTTTEPTTTTTEPTTTTTEPTTTTTEPTTTEPTTTTTEPTTTTTEPTTTTTEPTTTTTEPTPTPTNTPTNTPTSTPTNTPTNTPTSTPTNTPTNTPTDTPTPTPTNTPTNTPTATPFLFPFTGFFPPVDNPPTVNQVNAGRTIPVKFSLGGYRGMNIFAPGYPASVAVNCSSGAPIDDIEETTTNSGLTYDAGSDRYHYNWKTEKGWGGTCRQLILRLTDNTNHVANFKFK